MFLRNHDELDLGRLTDEQRQRVFEAFGPDKDMQLYDRGIRRRLAPMLDGDRRRLELAYSLMFTLPGTPVIRYGDELGMGDDLRSARAQLRAHADAMVDRTAWRASPRATSRCCRSSSSGPYGYRARQRRRAAARSEFAAELDRAHHPHAQGSAGDRLGRLRGARRRGDPAVLAMRYDWRNNSVLFVHNLDAKPREISFAVGLDGRRRAAP